MPCPEYFYWELGRSFSNLCPASYSPVQILLGPRWGESPASLLVPFGPTAAVTELWSRRRRRGWRSGGTTRAGYPGSKPGVTVDLGIFSAKERGAQCLDSALLLWSLGTAMRASLVGSGFLFRVS